VERQTVYPYLVVRLMATVYQREKISVRVGTQRVHIGFGDSHVHHPSPFETDGSLSAGCKTILVLATLDASRRTRHRMCLVWSADRCTFIELNGSHLESTEPPTAGFGTQGVDSPLLPAEIEFDKQGSVKRWVRDEDQ
jgi:hypothetical protein